MKKTLLLLLALAMVVACGGPKGYKLTGDVAGLDGTVYLALMQGKMPQILDSTQSVGGKFEFKGELKLPMLAQIQNAEKKMVTQFYLENSPIEIKGSLDKIDEITVTGSKEEDLAKSFATRVKAASSYEAAQDTMAAIIASNPKSVAAAYLFFRQMTPSLTFQQMRDIRATFDTTLQNNSIYLTLVEERAATMEKTSPGHPMIDFSLADTLGNMVKLSDVAGKGKYVLLDFWASWCGPCRRENPNVVAAFEAFGDKGFTVFGVSLDRNAEDWKKGIVKDNLNWTNVSDLQFWNCVPAATYGVSSIPANVLIDPTGMIVDRNIREEALFEALTKYLGEPKKAKK